MAEQEAEEVAQDIPEHENHRKKPYRPSHGTEDLPAQVSIKDLHPAVLSVSESTKRLVQAGTSYPCAKLPSSTGTQLQKRLRSP